MDENEEGSHPEQQRITTEVPPEHGEKTLSHLLSVARSAFDRGLDLDESVWRSLPLFAAVFGLAATIVGTSIPGLSRLDSSLFLWIGWTILLLATLSFAWAFRWVAVVIRPRSFEYPSTVVEISTYADELVLYHAQHIEDLSQRDIRVQLELMAFEIAQLGKASIVNDQHVRVRLKARSQALRFMIIGFALATVNSLTIYTAGAWYGNELSRNRGVGDVSDTNARANGGFAEAQGDSASRTTKGQDRGARRRIPPVFEQSRSQGQALSEKTAPTPSLPIEKPQAPPPQRVEKSQQPLPSHIPNRWR